MTTGWRPYCGGSPFTHAGVQRSYVCPPPACPTALNNLSSHIQPSQGPTEAWERLCSATFTHVDGRFEKGIFSGADGWLSDHNRAVL